MFDKTAAKITLSQRLSASSNQRVDVLVERLNASRNADDSIRKSNLLELLFTTKSDDQIVSFLDNRDALIDGLNKNFNDQVLSIQQANDIKEQISEGFNSSIEYLKASLRTTIEREIKKNLVDSFEQILVKTKEDFDL